MWLFFKNPIIWFTVRQQTRLTSTHRSFKETIAPGNEYVFELCTCHRKYNQPFKTVGCNKHHLVFHPSKLDIVCLYAASHRVHTHIQTWNQNKLNAFLRRQFWRFSLAYQTDWARFMWFHPVFMCRSQLWTSHRHSLSPCSLFFYHITGKAV